MKIIFLDIDGVLNCAESFKKRMKLVAKRELDYHRFDWPSFPYVGHLNSIIEATNAKIVISSTWRLLHPLDGNDFSGRCTSGLRDIFKLTGILGEIIDKTPEFINRFRGYEIKAWLKDHPEVKNYVIIDDSSDMLEDQMNNFVKTTWEKGLQQEHADKAIGILNK